MPLRAILIAMTTSLGLIGNTLAASPSVSPLGAGLDLSYDTSIASDGTTARTLAARAADTFNVRDFGAVGNGSSQTIGTTYGATLAALASYTTATGTKPFAWATNPIYGLTFTLNTSAAQQSGTSLTFLSSIAVNGVPVSLASWIIPANGQDVLQTGMQVSGACVVAGTTISAIATTTQTYSVGGTTANATAVPTGTITLSRPTSTACAAGTAITFTISPAQLAALTVDWLGMQSAVAAATSAYGGTVWLPAGAYYKSRPVVVPTFSNQNYVEQVEIKGDGVWNTQIHDTTDTGPYSCSIGEMNRGPGSTGHFVIHDIRLFGPASTSNTVGNFIAGMDGICIGAKGETQRISASGFHAGVNVLEDHQKIIDSEMAGDFYGIYMAPNGDTYGNLLVQQGAGAGEAWSAVGVAWNNTLDTSRWNGFSAVNSPYGYYRELPPSGQTIGLPFISNAMFDDDYAEALGNGWIYDENGVTGSIGGNTFEAILPSVGGGSQFQIPGRGVKAVIYTAGDVFNNRFINVDFAVAGNPNVVSDGLIEGGIDVQANRFDNITNAILSNTKPILVGGVVIFNFFTMDRAEGEFRRAESSLAAGELVAHGVDGVFNSARAMAAGTVPLGVVAQGQAAGAIVPVVTRGLVTAIKTTDVGVNNAAAVCASATTPTSVTACTNAPSQASIGVDEDGFNVGATSSTANIYVQIGPQPNIATSSAPGIVAPDGTTITINAAGKISAAPAATGAAVIGAVSYDPSADAGYICSGYNNTTTADVDPTNLQVSFVAPASGNVVVVLNAMVTSHTSGWQVYWSLGFASAAGGASSSDIAGTLGMVTNSNATLRVTHAVRLTGLTGGTTYYLNWRNATNQSSAQGGPFILVGQANTPYGPATMTVYRD